MLFKNNGESVKIRIGNLKGYDWITVRNGQEIDLPEKIGNLHGFEALEIPIEEQEKAFESKAGKKKVETKVKDSKKKRSANEIQDIKGIGQKTAKDILSAYPTEASLKEAISSGKNLPFRDDIVEKLINKYG
jgi:hypothetical protein